MLCVLPHSLYIQEGDLSSASFLPLQLACRITCVAACRGLPGQQRLHAPEAQLMCLCLLPAERLQDQQLPVHLGAYLGGDTVCSAEGLDWAATTAPPAAGEDKVCQPVTAQNWTTSC